MSFSLALVALTTTLLTQSTTQTKPTNPPAAKRARTEHLVSFKAMPVRLRVPAGWKHSVEEGTHRFDSPAEDGSFRLDVGAVDESVAPMAAERCRDKLINSLGPDEWTKLTLGGFPAARKRTVDADKKKKAEIETISYLGCDGWSTFAITFSWVLASSTQYTPLSEKVVSSIEFLEGDSNRR
jgi:hypothetical protein